GMPFGNNAASTVSRSNPSLTCCTVPRVDADRLLIRPAPVSPALAAPRAEEAFARAARELPATPWLRLRCAPNACGRLNVLPHSGQTNAPCSCSCCDGVAPAALVLEPRRLVGPSCLLSAAFALIARLLSDPSTCSGACVGQW